MDDPLPSLASHLAANLAALRERRGWTQATAARIAGVPRSTVTYMESGAGNPSLGNLARLAQAFQVSVEELISRPRPNVTHVPRREVKEILRSGVKVRKLLPDPLPGMEMDRMDLGPGARLRGTPHLEGTREYLYCEKGSIHLYVAREQYRLDAGDVLAFPGSLPHAYENPDQARRAQAFSVVVLG